MLYFPYNTSIFLLQYTFRYDFRYVLNAASLESTPEKSLKRERLYLLAVGHYRAGDITRARQFINEALVVSIGGSYIGNSMFLLYFAYFFRETPKYS